MALAPLGALLRPWSKLVGSIGGLVRGQGFGHENERGQCDTHECPQEWPIGYEVGGTWAQAVIGVHKRGTRRVTEQEAITEDA